MPRWDFSLLAAFLAKAQGALLAEIPVVGKMKPGDRTNAGTGIGEHGAIRGVADADNGRMVTIEEVRKIVSEWISNSNRSVLA